MKEEEKYMKNNIVYVMMIVTFITGILLSCADKVSTIKIGLVGPYSGPVAPYAESALRVVQLELDTMELPSNLEITLISEDDMCDATQSSTVASRFVAQEVVAVIGPMCSDAVISAMPTYSNEGIVVISPSATAPMLTDGTHKGFFRTIVSDDIQGRTLANFVVSQLAVTNIALIHDKSEYGKGLVDVAKNSLETTSNVQIDIYDGITPEALDYSAVVSKIIAKNPNAVLFGGYHSEAAKLVTQLRTRGYEGDIVGGEGIKGVEFINLVGDDAEGIYASAPQDFFDNDEYRRIKKLYQDEFSSDPGIFFYESQAALAVLVEALKTGNNTGQEIIDYLSSGKKFVTSIGEISFNPNGEVVGSGYSMYQVKNGKFTLTN